MKKDPTVPVYVITGFLDGGKTRFLKQTLSEDYFNDGSSSLILLLEEGEEEFSEEELTARKASLEVLTEEQILSEEYLSDLQKKYNPDRVLIEYNGVLDVTKFFTTKLPEHWMIYQVITIFDGPNFKLYLSNIKTNAMALLTNTDMVIFNRCTKDTDMVSYQRALRSVNQRAELVFEDVNGEELECPEPDLPYSVDGPQISISDENFATFYIDLSQHPDRYVNKQITFLMQIMKNKTFPKNMFVGGRRAMTCCEADIRFLPFIFVYDHADMLKAASFAKITATMKWEYHEGYQGEGPVFHTDDLVLTAPPKEEVISF